MPEVKEQIQLIQAVPLTITEWAVPIKMAEAKKTEQLTPKGEKIDEKEEPLKQDLAVIIIFNNGLDVLVPLGLAQRLFLVHNLFFI